MTALDRMYSQARSYHSLQHQSKYVWGAQDNAKSASRQQRDFTNALICLSFLVLVNIGLSLAAVIISLYSLTATCNYAGSPPTDRVASSRGGATVPQSGLEGHAPRTGRAPEQIYSEQYGSRGGGSYNGIHVDSRGGIYITPKSPMYNPEPPLHHKDAFGYMDYTANSQGATVGTHSIPAGNIAMEHHHHQVTSSASSSLVSTPSQASEKSENHHATATTTWSDKAFVQQKSTLIVRNSSADLPGKHATIEPDLLHLHQNGILADPPGISYGAGVRTALGSHSTHITTSASSVQHASTTSGGAAGQHKQAGGKAFPRVVEMEQQFGNSMSREQPEASFSGEQHHNVNVNGERHVSNGGPSPPTNRGARSATSSSSPSSSAGASAGFSTTGFRNTPSTSSNTGGVSSRSTASEMTGSTVPSSTGDPPVVGTRTTAPTNTADPAITSTSNSAVENIEHNTGSTQTRLSSSTTTRYFDDPRFPILVEAPHNCMGRGYDSRTRTLHQQVLQNRSQFAGDAVRPQLAVVTKRTQRRTDAAADLWSLLPDFEMTYVWKRGKLVSRPGQTAADLSGLRVSLLEGSHTGSALGVSYFHSGAKKTAPRKGSVIEDINIIASATGQGSEENGEDASSDGNSGINNDAESSSSSVEHDIVIVGCVKVAESWFEWQHGGQSTSPGKSSIRGSLMEIFSPSAWPGVDASLHDFLRDDSHNFDAFRTRFGAEVVTKTDVGGIVILRLQLNPGTTQSDAVNLAREGWASLLENKGDVSSTAQKQEVRLVTLETLGGTATGQWSSADATPLVPQEIEASLVRWLRGISSGQNVVSTRLHAEPITDLLRHCKTKTCQELIARLGEHIKDHTLQDGHDTGDRGAEL
ncbi:unnamed protein product [Amoebophrya sp. A25]|nr:unnamed protein product [Amoebophrya sp. A25]|eukprot:GSA25T00002292001.1